MISDSNIFDPFMIYEDPKEIELVQNITEKTRSGRIVWQRSSPSSLVATVPGMQISFVRSGSFSPFSTLLGGPGWEVFSIRNLQGNEIVKLQQPSTIIFSVAPASGSAFPPVPPPRTKLQQAVDELYSVADTKGEGDIDKAIKVVKNL